VVILSIPTTNYTGTTTGSPTVTTSGSNTIITFTSSGSYTAWRLILIFRLLEWQNLLIHLDL
jgi:hypothetical protein